MALVAYSDESDFSEEESEKDVNPSKSLNRSHNSISSKVSSNPLLLSGVDSIIDEDEDNAQAYGRLHESLPLDESKTDQQKHILFPISTQDGNKKVNLDVNEDQDILDDVPTVNTWKLTKNLKNCDKSFQLSLEPIKRKKNKKNKLQFILPSLAELQDDSEEDAEQDACPERKKFQPSADGTGLFAVLPKPKNTTSSLIPNSVSRPKMVKPITKPKKFISNYGAKLKNSVLDKTKEDSEDELENGDDMDFFSLNKSPDVPVPLSVPEVTNGIFPKFDIDLSKNVSGVQEDSNTISNEVNVSRVVENTESVSFIPVASSSQFDSTDPEEIDHEALLRLRGRRNRGEAVNVIDINADDALMSRHEWMTRSMAEAKPTKSFSKKKDGNPTQLQRRKHQITFLAHQAQEREQDLQNTWGQNRYTKMQTQSKYGF